MHFPAHLLTLIGKVKVDRLGGTLVHSVWPTCAIKLPSLLVDEKVTSGCVDYLRNSKT